MLYKIALFLHVSGALMLSAALALEWLCILNIRKTNSIERVKESVFNYSKLVKVGDIGVFMILIPGIYMMMIVWGDAGWAIIGFIGLIIIGAIGGVMTGKRMKQIKKIIETKNNGSQDIENLLKNSSFWISIKVRTAILLGIIFLMTVKPDLAGSIVVIILSIVLGSVPLKMRRNLPSTVVQNVTLKNESNRHEQ